MGVHSRLFAPADALTDHDAAQLLQDTVACGSTGSGPFSGFAMRNGKPIPFTLDTRHMAPEVQGILPEQIAIAALLLASFVAPIWHLLA